MTPDKLVDALNVLLAPDQVAELRALKVKEGNKRPHTISGYYDFAHRHEMAKDAISLSRFAAGVYFTLNPVNPDLLSRSCNRSQYAANNESTADKDILCRRWLLIDADPKRVSGVSATDAEKLYALATAENVRRHLTTAGWPEPIFADSGNGYHLLYQIDDLPRDDGGLVQRVLLALGMRFDSEHVSIDKTVYNPARICKLPYTWTRKGDNTKDRPHRQSCLLNVPATISVVPNELLRNLAGPDAKPDQPKPSNGKYSNRLLVDRWLNDRGRGYQKKPDPEGKGRTVYLLDECPFNASHTAPDSCVMQSPSGQLSAHCFHDSCTGKGWAHFRDAIGKPDSHHYDPPIGRFTWPDSKQSSQATGTATTASPDDAGLEFTRLSTLKGKPIKWLVPKRIPLGKVTLLAADGGSGKSTVMRSIAAKISRGFGALGLDYPSPGAGDVILCAAEDSYEEIVVPHLICEGANLDRIYQVHHVKTEPDGTKFKVHLKLEHIAELKEKVRQNHGIKLIVIDPVISLVSGARLSNNQGEEVRLILDQLNALADETGVSVVVIAHLNKTATNKATYRVSGSAQWIAAVRVAYMVAPDPDDPTQRLLIPVKRNILNLEESAATFRLNRLIDFEAETYRHHPALAELSDEDFAEVTTQMARVSYGHTKNVNADEVFAPKKPDDSQGCEQWIKTRLGNEYAWLDERILAEANKAGHSLGQYKRAKRNLRDDGLRSFQPPEFGGKWRVGFGNVKNMPLAPEHADIPTDDSQSDTTVQSEPTVQTVQTDDLFNQSEQSEQSEQSAQSEQCVQKKNGKEKSKPKRKKKKQLQPAQDDRENLA